MTSNTPRELSLKGYRLLSSLDGDIDPDYVRDNNEAYHARMAEVAEELRDMSVQDREQDKRDGRDYQLALSTGYRGRTSAKRESAGAVYVQNLLIKIVGVSDVVSTVDDSDLELLRLTASSMSTEQKSRYRMLSAVGDAALTLALTRVCLHKGMTAEQYQSKRSSVTTNGHLAARFADSFPGDFLSAASGAPVSTKTAASAIEAVLGVVELGSGSEWVSRSAFSLRIFGGELE